MKKALVLGGGGFIGGHMVRKLTSRGYWVRSVDLKEHEYGAKPNEFFLGDLCKQDFVSEVFQLNDMETFDEVYQFAADMGGAGYIFSGDNDAQVMYNSSQINLNVINEVRHRRNLKRQRNTRIFYSSSACIYPENMQTITNNPGLKEEDAYPANPDSEYGWEKLFSERVYLAFNRNFELDIRIGRFHNIFGPEGTWRGGKEKSPAAICRKIAEAKNGDEIEIWGDGEQTRSFLYIDECLNAIEKLMYSNFLGPVNIGSEEMISINNMAHLIADIAGKKISLRHIKGPLGVRGRNSNNDLVRQKLNWDYSMSLRQGLEKTYAWIEEQVIAAKYV